MLSNEIEVKLTNFSNIHSVFEKAQPIQDIDFKYYLSELSRLQAMLVFELGNSAFVKKENYTIANDFS